MTKTGAQIIVDTYPVLIKAKVGLKMIYSAINGKSAMAAIKFAILFFAILTATLRIRMNIFILLI